MACAKGVPGYGMIHPNLINSSRTAMLWSYCSNGHFDAMSLAPNFDLLLNQQKAVDVARLMAEWNNKAEDLGERGPLLVQPPLDPTTVEMNQHQACIDPSYRSATQTILMSQVADVMSMADESLWLTPIMNSILQEQGTNIRAMCHHILRCKESVALKPRLDATTVQNTIETVINENWLHWCLTQTWRKYGELLRS